MGQNNFFKWITVPPVVAILTIMLARSMGTGSVVGEVDLSIWGLVWLVFIVLSFLYGSFIIHGFNAGLIPLNALCQGALLCPMALTYGARMFQWLGVIIAVCGAAALVVAYNNDERERAKKSILPISDDVSKFPITCTVTDDTGLILKASESFLDILEITQEESIGKNITDWFSPVSTTCEINNKIYNVSRYPFSDNKHFLFMLAPKTLADNVAATSSQTAGNVSFFDSDTALHSFAYGSARISDELYRVARYNRPLSACLIRLVFPQLLPDDDMDRYIRPFRAWCNSVMKNVRQSDTVIQAGEFQVIAVFSECPYQMVDEVTERLGAITNELAATFEEFLKVTVMTVSESYESGSNLPTAQELIDKLTAMMTRKYSATALTQ